MCVVIHIHIINSIMCVLWVLLSYTTLIIITTNTSNGDINKENVCYYDSNNNNIMFIIIVVGNACCYVNYNIYIYINTHHTINMFVLIGYDKLFLLLLLLLFIILMY